MKKMMCLIGIISVLLMAGCSDRNVQTEDEVSDEIIRDNSGLSMEDWTGYEIDVLFEEKGLMLQCAEWSYREELAWNLTCEYTPFNDKIAVTSEIYNKISKDKYCNFHIVNEYGDNGELILGETDELINTTSALIQVEDECLRYDIVPLW